MFLHIFPERFVPLEKSWDNESAKDAEQKVKWKLAIKVHVTQHNSGMTQTLKRFSCFIAETAVVFLRDKSIPHSLNKALNFIDITCSYGAKGHPSEKLFFAVIFATSAEHTRSTSTCVTSCKICRWNPFRGEEEKHESKRDQTGRFKAFFV